MNMTDINRQVGVSCSEKDGSHNGKGGVTAGKIVAIVLFILLGAALVIVLTQPIFRIYGDTMSPNLKDGDIVVALKDDTAEPGDVAAIDFNSKILVRRIIAVGGDQVEIDEDGNVSVNGKALDEPYLKEKSLGECDISFPYGVPDGMLFVMGDNRNEAPDSRLEEIGCVSDDQICGKIVFCVWPLSDFGIVKGI